MGALKYQKASFILLFWLVLRSICTSLISQLSVHPLIAQIYVPPSLLSCVYSLIVQLRAYSLVSQLCVYPFSSQLRVHILIVQLCAPPHSAH